MRSHRPGPVAARHCNVFEPAAPPAVADQQRVRTGLAAGGRWIRTLGRESSRPQASYSAISSVVFGDKTGDNTPLS